MTPLARIRAIVGGSAGNLVERYDWLAHASFSLFVYVAAIMALAAGTALFMGDPGALGLIDDD